MVAWWRGSRKELWLKLGLSIFILTAFVAVITSYWFPWQLRLFHGLELLAGSLVYAGVLAALLWVAARQPTRSPEKRRSNDGEPGFVQLLTGSIQV
ncbi:MAG TPA: hypothetical protein VGK00_15440 [Anaerolineales bacterium]|jgi:hypothetical protein